LIPWIARKNYYEVQVFYGFRYKKPSREVRQHDGTALSASSAFPGSNSTFPIQKSCRKSRVPKCRNYTAQDSNYGFKKIYFPKTDLCSKLLTAGGKWQQEEDKL